MISRLGWGLFLKNVNFVLRDWSLKKWLFIAALSLLPISSMADQPQPLLGTANPAWEKLKQHFQAVALTQNAQPLRILHLGDSHTAGNAFSGRLRKLFQQRFSDSGPGLLPPGNLRAHNNGPFRIHQTDGWISERARKLSMPGNSTLGGVIAYSKRPYQLLSYELLHANLNARLILYTDHEDTDRPLRYKVYHNQKEIKPITKIANGRVVYNLLAGNGQLDILSRSGGPAPRLLALNLLYEIPGVSYCSLGVNGATFNILQEWRGVTVRLEMTDYKPDLLILEFGTNDVLAPKFSRETFLATLKQTNAWIKEYANDAAVLLILPPGMLRQDSHTEQNLNTLRNLIFIASENHGWLVWDWYHALNRGGQSRMLSESRYGPDGIHLTEAGYTQSANWLFAALSAFF